LANFAEIKTANFWSVILLFSRIEGNKKENNIVAQKMVDVVPSLLSTIDY